VGLAAGLQAQKGNAIRINTRIRLPAFMADMPISSSGQFAIIY
jgi:hypothetical protein